MWGGETRNSQWRSPRGVARNPRRMWWPRSQERETLEDRQNQPWSPPERQSLMSLQGLAERSYYSNLENTEFSVANRPIWAKWIRNGGDNLRILLWPINLATWRHIPCKECSLHFAFSMVDGLLSPCSRSGLQVACGMCGQTSLWFHRPCIWS